jgi:hypothetical protein
MSDQTTTLASALAKAQSAMKNAPLNKVNPHFKSKYADLAAIRDAVVPALSANGIAVTQTPEFRDGSWVLVTTLRGHGETIESVYPLTIDKPQAMGSQLTYAKRYSLSSICGISADEDDDGNAAQQSETKVGGTKSGKPDQRVSTADEEKEARQKAEEWTEGKAQWLQGADTHQELQSRWEQLEHSEAFKKLGKKHADLCEVLMTAKTYHETALYGRAA